MDLVTSIDVWLANGAYNNMEALKNCKLDGGRVESNNGEIIINVTYNNETLVKTSDGVPTHATNTHSRRATAYRCVLQNIEFIYIYIHYIYILYILYIYI